MIFAFTAVAIVGATLIDVSREGRIETDIKDSVVLVADGRENREIRS